MCNRWRSAAAVAMAATVAMAAAPAWTAAPPPAGTAQAAGEPPPVGTISPDELTVGQRGYGLSVFAGREPERFEAEVVGVIRNLAPGTSFILARLTGHGLEESGVVAGMSGSPVYFGDRLAGAVAFSWPFAREAIAGVMPIEAMHRIPAAAPGVPGAPPPAEPGAATGPPVALADLATGRIPADLVDRELARFRPALAFGAHSGLGWTATGFAPEVETLMARRLGPLAPSGEANDAPAQPLVAGGSVAAILVDGDFRLAALATVTDVEGDAVFAFGHPFLGLGPVKVPMAVSEVLTVLSSQQSSFKIGNLGPVVGAFEEDRQAGLRGRLGAEAPMIPFHLVVRGGETREYRMRLAAIPAIAPTLAALSTLSSLNAASYANGTFGLDLAARFQLAGRGELAVAQSFDGNAAAVNAAGYLLAVAGFLLQNDLARVDVTSIEVEVTQTPAPRTATLVGAHAERYAVHPGERIALNLDFTAWRGEPFRRTVEVDLPEDLPSGKYYLFVGDGASVDAARLAVEKSEPVNLGQALDLLRSLHSRRELVVLGMLARPGLAVAGTVLPNLPGSVRSIWAAAASGSATPLQLAVAQQQAVGGDVPLEGIVRIDLRVLRREPVAAAGPEAANGEGEQGRPAPEEGAAEPAEPPPAAPGEGAP